MFCFGGEDGHAKTSAYSDVAAIKSYKSNIPVIFFLQMFKKRQNEGKKCKQSILNIV